MKRNMMFAGFIVAGLVGCGAPMDEQQAEQQPTPAAEATPSTESLGETEQDIIGGWYASPNQFPYQVRIMVNGQPWCGGTLVRSNWVVTAAHCVYGVNYTTITVVAGDNIINTWEANEQSRTINGYAYHPNYGSISGAPINDVAVIQTSSPFILNGAVSTLAGPTGPAPIGATMTTSGWGQTAASPSPQSNDLKYTYLPINAPAACSPPNLTRALYAGFEICAGYASGVTGGCHGDSGGPLAYNGQLYGIVSWGRGGTCNSYTAYTDVWGYKSFITAYIGAW